MGRDERGVEVLVNDIFTRRPADDEYAAYYAVYVASVPPGSILDLLKSGIEETSALLEDFGEARGDYRYAPGKWSVKDVMGHLIDSERVFAYRLLRIARGDQTALAGFDHDEYVRVAHFERRTLADLAEEFRMVRAANLRLFASLGEDELPRRGTASEKPVSARALLYILAGHEIHHRGVLKDRYAA
jgi:uncharacterized damage-inducible protein DinB